MPVGGSPGTLDDVEPPISDEELTQLALDADPDTPLADDAVPLDGLDPSVADDGAALPAWYLPPARGVGRTRARMVVAGVVVVALLASAGAGLCVTAGLPEIAW